MKITEEQVAELEVFTLKEQQQLIEDGKIYGMDEVKSLKVLTIKETGRLLKKMNDGVNNIQGSILIRKVEGIKGRYLEVNTRDTGFIYQIPMGLLDEKTFEEVLSKSI